MEPTTGDEDEIEFRKGAFEICISKRKAYFANTPKLVAKAISQPRQPSRQPCLNMIFLRNVKSGEKKR